MVESDSETESRGVCRRHPMTSCSRSVRKRLQEHLAVCPSCQEATNQYDAVVSKAIPALARDPGQVESDPSWSQEQAEAAFFRRLTLEEELDTVRREADGDVPKDLSRVPLSATQATGRNVWTLCAAGVLLCIALGVSAYRVGIRRGTESAPVAPVKRPIKSNCVATRDQRRRPRALSIALGDGSTRHVDCRSAASGRPAISGRQAGASSAAI